MDKATFNIPSIGCSICSGKIQEELKNTPGIGNTSVDLKAQTLNVDFDASVIGSKDIKKKITGLGYEVNS